MATQTGSISFESQGGFQSYASGQYATLAQVKGQFATCSTAAGTQAKAATIVPTDSGWALYTGATITVKFTTANTHATPTLNVNSTGAKSIRDHTGATLTEDAYNWAAGTAMSFTYDGTYWRLQDTLSQRVTTAETAIVENAGKIELRATKTEAYQLSQPNLTPYYSMPKADTRSANPTSGYWASTWQTNATMITTWDFQQAGPDGAGGWAHLVTNNTGSSNVYAPSYIHKDGLSLKPSTTYTILAEWAGATVSGTVGISPTTQHGGTNGANDDFFTTSTSVTLTSGSGSKAFVVTTRAALESGCNNRIRSHVSISAGASFDGYVRLSIYEGEYTGPYKPYVGPTLYASQADLKVTSDEISSKVSKDGVISSINQSAESVTINASKVNITGVITAINNDTTTTIDGGKITAHTITADSLAIGAVDVGGRNILKGTKDYSTKSTSNQTGITISSDTYAGTLVLTGTRSSGNMDVGRFDSSAFADTIKPNTYYTLSFWAKASQPTTCTSYFWTSGDQGVVSGKNSFGYTTTQTNGGLINDIPTEWTYCWATWKTADSTVNMPDRIVPLRSTTTGRTIYIAGIKLERGNKPTDWTAAPEDVDADISDAAKTASNYITEDASGIKIHATGNSTTYQHQTATTTTYYVSGNKRAEVSADGLETFDGTYGSEVSTAKFGSTARIGKADSGHMTIGNDTITMYGSDGSIEGFSVKQANVGTESVVTIGIAGGQNTGVLDGPRMQGYYEQNTATSYLNVEAGSAVSDASANVGLTAERTWTSDSTKSDSATVNLNVSNGGVSPTASIGVESGGNESYIAMEANSTNASIGLNANRLYLEGVGCYMTHGNVGQNINVPANSYVEYPSSSTLVSFGHNYGSSTPDVVVSLFSTSTAAKFGGLSIAVSYVTSTGFRVRIFNNTDTARTPGFHWIAMG